MCNTQKRNLQYIDIGTSKEIIPIIHIPQRHSICKVEIFLKQRKVAFLSPSKFCWVIRMQLISVLKLALLYHTVYMETKWFKITVL